MPPKKTYESYESESDTESPTNSWMNIDLVLMPTKFYLNTKTFYKLKIHFT